ncbi:MAG: PVC-type heme-binding CxxCH protein [Sphingobacteriaceae bacterium]
MKKILLVLAFLSACFWLTAYKLSNQTSRAERDTVYSKLTEEQKRLPKNAIAGLEIKPGLTVSLFASEPMMGNPTNMDIDAKGRVWVCEAYNYRSELNPDNPSRKEGDRILILEDTNGDGRADTAKVFYQGTDINAALGIVVLGNKVIVSCSPNVFVFTDTDGDDVADKKEVLFTHLNGSQHDHAVHAFTFGPDGKFYFNFGNAGEQIFDKNGLPVIDKDGKEVNDKGNPYRQGMIFRVNPDGTEFEVLAHNFRNNYEVAVDSYGTLWQSDNDDDGNQGVRINYVMPYGNYGYTDEMTGAGWQADRINIEKEVPLRHWHQNDPGSIPNLLQTGAGSPTGMIVYEGSLLPEEFRNQMIHSDAGPNVVRSYPVTVDGAGYKASVVNILNGVRDQWFRPSDVCVAPDGSLFVADWYDPGVGGHQMRDMDRGRIYRISPPNTPYKIPKLNLSNNTGAVDALKSPNLATRYLAWEKLHSEGKKAESALKKLWTSDNQRFRARSLWLLAKIPGKSKTYIREALKDANADIRITGLRIALQEEKDVIPYIKQLVNDPDAQVRREAAIALHHQKSAEAPVLWAELANKYDGKDRWYLEALGIGADSQWDTFFAVWLEKAGAQVNTTAGRDIVWRSRTKLALPLLAKNITDEKTTLAERLKYFRAFDFIKDPEKEKTLLSLLDNKGTNQDEIALTALRLIQPESVAASPTLMAVLNQVLESQKGKPEYLGLVERYKMKSQNPELLKIGLSDPESNSGVAATRLLLRMDGIDLIKNVVYGANKMESLAALKSLGKIGNKESSTLIESVILNNAAEPAVRQVAVKSLASNWGGEEQLLKLWQSNKLPKDLEQVAIVKLSTAQRSEIRKVAISHTGNSKTVEGKNLPAISALIQMKGDVKGGEAIYTKLCSSCHQVGKSGANFGPALTEIGGKLTREALYVSILHPDAGISFGFEGYQIKLKDGSETMGIIASQTADAIEVTSPGGSKTSYKKSEIASQTQMAGSLMPANLEQTMSQKELTDLVEFLYSLKSKK